MRITNELLVRIGGWRAAKDGRAAFEAGRVLSVAYEPPLLSGVVATANGSISARIRFAPKDVDIENLCSCRDARENGTICPHVLALGYAWILRDEPASKPAAASPATSPASPSALPTSAPKQEPLFAWQEIEEAPSDALPLECTVILPPSLADGTVPDRIQIYLEASINGAAPAPLEQALKRHPGAVFAVSNEDARLLTFLETPSVNRSGALFQLPRTELDAFFNACAAHPGISIARKLALQIDAESERPTLSFTLDDKTGSVTLQAREAPPPPGKPISTWYLDGPNLRRHIALPAAYKSALIQPVVLDRAQFARFFSGEAASLVAIATIEPEDFLDRFRLRTATPIIIAEFDGSEAGIHVRLRSAYPGAEFPITGINGKVDETPHPDPSDPLIYWQRNIRAEDEARRLLATAGFTPGRRDESLYVSSDRDIIPQFFASHLPRLRDRWQVTLSDRLTALAARTIVLKPVLNFAPSQGGNWLEGNLSFVGLDKDSITFAEVRQMLDSGRSTRRTQDGRMLVIPEDGAADLAEVLTDMDVRQTADGHFRMRSQQAAFLVESVRAAGGQPPATWTPPSLRDAPPLILPQTLEAIMRPYQKQGAAWLTFLASNELAGILADEMGLGKTLQTLAFIFAWRSKRTASGPCLVVCPTSLVTNWISESARFTPELPALAYHGTDRARLRDQLASAGLVVTSYAILRRDIETLAAIDFDLVALDEAQHIKNRESQNAQAAKALRASHRLVLTGTPVENSLGDLWSIFDFLMPGYLGRRDDFRDRYEIPISRTNDESAMARLRRRIGPFVLRRTKHEVAPELPSRISELTWCDLTTEQATVYNAILEQSRRDVFEHSGTKGNVAKQRLAIFSALLRLRQACCHLALLPSDDEKKWDEPSAKFEACLERIDEAIDGGHRVLIYSQFVRLLSLLRSELKTRDIDYCYLDGQTKDRAGEVARFQKADGPPLFLVSLKAGGTGLNLTAADTVMLLDPWWNPAVEEQAIARAHRIGQDKTVVSYRFITRGTVEERIQRLQQTKGDLAANTLADSGAAPLSIGEMEDLLRE